MNTTESPFVWRGEHTGLDFINTEVVQQGKPADLIENTSLLLRWLGEAGVAADGERDQLARAWAADPYLGGTALTEFRTFRSAIREMIEALAASARVPEKTLEELNRRLAAGKGCWQVQATEGTRQLVFLEQESQTAEARFRTLLARLARSVGELICGEEWRRIRRCENPRCILYFLDTSKNHRRRWCCMRACGNRAKAAAFYRRNRAEKAGEEGEGR